MGNQGPAWGGVGAQMEVTATNKAHFPYLVNWACGCRSHFSEDMRKQTLVLAADDETYAMARKSGFIAMPPSLFNDEEWAEKMNLTRNNVAKMGFPDSMAILVTCLTQLLEMKYTVITQDADVVWLKDVRHYLSSEKLRNVHLITQKRYLYISLLNLVGLFALYHGR
eukprot:jgi/Bigna1/139470/aug1.50_g14178